MVKFEYLEPTSLQEALSLLSRYGDEARLIAGGTALILLMKQRLVNPRYVISLQKIAGLDYIRYDSQEGLHIGALATHRDLERSPVLRQHYPLLAETFHEVASQRIRAMGTLGGNLCHADPLQDPPVALMALDTSVKLVSARNERLVRLDEFFTGYYETVREPDEILTEIQVPSPPPQMGWGRIKFTPRSKQDFATVGVAMTLNLNGNGRCEDLRIALNGVGPVVLRARKAEEVLRGQQPTEALLRQTGEVAATETDPLDDVRGSAEYKREMVRVWVRRVGLQALERAKG